jgi:hypothetical protein
MVIRPEGGVKLKIFMLDGRLAGERSFTHLALHTVKKGSKALPGEL